MSDGRHAADQPQGERDLRVVEPAPGGSTGTPAAAGRPGCASGTPRGLPVVLGRIRRPAAGGLTRASSRPGARRPPRCRRAADGQPGARPLRGCRREPRRRSAGDVRLLHNTPRPGRGRARRAPSRRPPRPTRDGARRRPPGEPRSFVFWQSSGRTSTAPSMIGSSFAVATACSKSVVSTTKKPAITSLLSMNGPSVTRPPRIAGRRSTGPGAPARRRRARPPRRSGRAGACAPSMTSLRQVLDRHTLHRSTRRTAASRDLRSIVHTPTTNESPPRSTTLPGFMIPAGSQRVLDRAQQFEPELADLVAEVGRVVAADRVVVGDRPAGGDDRARGGVLDRAPLRDRIGGLAPEHREVQRGAASGTGARCGSRRGARAARRSTARVEPLEVAPRRRGLQRLDEHAAVEQVVAQVRARRSVTSPTRGPAWARAAARRRARACAPPRRARARPASRTRAGSARRAAAAPRAGARPGPRSARVSSSSESRAMSGAIPSCSSSRSSSAPSRNEPTPSRRRTPRPAAARAARPT